MGINRISQYLPADGPTAVATASPVALMCCPLAGPAWAAELYRLAWESAREQARGPWYARLLRRSAN